MSYLTCVCVCVYVHVCVCVCVCVRLHICVYVWGGRQRSELGHKPKSTLLRGYAES